MYKHFESSYTSAFFKKVETPNKYRIVIHSIISCYIILFCIVSYCVCDMSNERTTIGYNKMNNNNNDNNNNDDGAFIFYEYYNNETQKKKRERKREKRM